MNMDEARELYGLELHDFEYDEDPPELQGEGDANWHLRAHLTALGEAEQVKARFDAEIRRLTERRDERLETLHRAAEWHGSAVEAWHRAMLRSGRTKAKTLHLPAGVSKVTAGRKKVERVGMKEDEFRAFLSGIVDPETGETAESKVYRRTTSEDFMVSELSKLGIKPRPAKKGEKDPEPGSMVSLYTDNGEGTKVPGLVAIVPQPTWSGRTE